MTLSDFWESTPREIVEFIDGMVERHRRAYRLATIQAYYAGAIARSDGKLPKYDDLFAIDDDSPKEPATAEDHVRFWENTAAIINAGEAARQAAANSGHDRI